MIGYIKGKIIALDEESVTVDTGGVGYQVFIADEQREELRAGQEKEFFVWTYLRQDTLELYGCISSQQLQFFKYLTKVSGIGPKIALSLSLFGTPEALKKEIEEKGSDFSKEVKGLGNKKMKRLLLELTGKVKELKKDRVSDRAGAVSALTNLGFSKKQAQEAVLKVPEKVEDQKQVVERALKLLGKND